MNHIHKKQLFIASCIALVATAMTFAIRANTIGHLGNTFGISLVDMGIVSSTAFWGFTLSIIFGGTLCDLLGMKRLLIFSFAGHTAGIILTILATGFWSLFFSTLLIGIANGFVEAACNPLVSTLYPEEKTKRLNLFHVWFPGGIVIGGLAAYGLEKINYGWQWQMLTILIPTVVYGILFFPKKFPLTERVSRGVSMKEMFRECKNPLFIFMTICMFFTAATELGTNQWIVELLANAGVPAILLLVFINGLMAVGRSFAGKVEPLLSPSGMLLFSAIFSAAGLLMLGNANGYWTFAAAAVFAIGICYFWPTMLGFVSEYLPKTGALGLSIMGAAGMLSVSYILPFIADVYEVQTQINLPAGLPLTEESMKNAKLAGGAATLQYVALLPMLLSIAFGFLYIFKNKLKNQISDELRMTNYE